MTAASSGAGGKKVFAVEAGGSSTRAALGQAGGPVSERHRFGPVNPASVPPDEAHANWITALSWVRDTAGPGCAGWIATASLADANPVPALDAIVRAMRRVGLTGTVAASNDVVPLLLGPPLHGNGFALVGGTGSTCIAGSPDRRAVRVGGHEYVLSDEGSGYQVGLAGLRAALRAAEGTAPETALSGWHPDLAVYARHLATSPRAKAEIAAFARVVVSCSEEGDPVAASILRAAAEDLVSLVRAASRKLHREAENVLLCGSLIGVPAMAGPVDLLLRQHWPGCVVRAVPDAIEQCLALAAMASSWPESTVPPLLVHKIA